MGDLEKITTTLIGSFKMPPNELFRMIINNLCAAEIKLSEDLTVEVACFKKAVGNLIDAEHKKLLERIHNGELKVNYDPS